MWLRQAIESGRYRGTLTAEEKQALFRRLCEVEGMERFLRKRFLGQKQFSLEGLDVMIPMLDETIELASEAGAHDVVLGMAHRGRLNVLAHTIGMPYEYILREFEGERTIDAVAADPEGGTGDVKYHLAAHGTRTTANGKVGVRLVANPSHLEAVEPGRRGTHPRRADGPLDAERRARSVGRARRCCCTATRRSRDRASSPRRSTSTASRATRPAARCT